MRRLAIGLAILLALVALAGLRRDLILAFRGVAVHGTIVHNDGRLMRFTYADRAEAGSAYTGAADAARFPRSRVGDPIRVRYLPANPDVAKAAGTCERWPFPALVLAIVTAIAGLFAPRQPKG